MSNKPSMQTFKANSFLFGGSADYLEELYEAYLVDPKQVSPEWQTYFQKLPTVNGASSDVSHAAIRAHFEAIAKQGYAPQVVMDESQATKQAAVIRLVMAYRRLGHLQAKLDPLAMQATPNVPELSLQHVGLTEQDLSTHFYREMPTGSPETLKDMIESLKATYCGHIGTEFMYMSTSDEVAWFTKHLETAAGQYRFSEAEQKSLLTELMVADTLEMHLGKRFVGQKRFSLEGGDSLIPMLWQMLSHASKAGVLETVIGMAHRGRLNVLMNIMGKPAAELYKEFEGITGSADFSSDVKYHKGYSADLPFEDKTMHVALAFNPSHLEIVNPVVEGSARLRQERLHDQDGTKVLPVLIHGDAAMAGQGVVAETFNMSQTRGFYTGGTVHIVINNQIGFTTSNPRDSRSTRYATDVAKMVEAPVLHVNGDDVEACVFAILLALDYRQQFHRDVVIDLICYRRHGHNESDEPMMTQPQMYQHIKAHATPVQLYADKLIKAGLITAEQLATEISTYRDKLDAGGRLVTLAEKAQPSWHDDWSKAIKQDWREPVKTAVDKATLLKLGEKLTHFPEGFTLQPQVLKEYESRQKMLSGEQPLFWGMAETLAYASLLTEGIPVRLCGQDSGRGTFSHRHADVYDIHTNEVYTPLQHLAKDQAPFVVIDSVLSEESVLAFEYGYSISDPNRLVIWEAQYGDFYNGAQAVVDQFISSSEQKWQRYSGLTLFLPHGMEGSGPEHSSARVERFLQLCAQNNMQICIPSTPSQMFHLLRRQMLRHYRKPLVIFTPKSLLRNKLVVSDLSELTDGQFLPVIDDAGAASRSKKITRVIICTGKVYYDLWHQREKLGRDDVALLRIEQLYPFPDLEFSQIYKSYTAVKQVIWCQEEPYNQGAWFKVCEDLQPLLAKGVELRYVGRPEAAAPAVGSSVTHAKQQQELVDAAFAK